MDGAGQVEEWRMRMESLKLGVEKSGGDYGNRDRED